MHTSHEDLYAFLLASPACLGLSIIPCEKQVFKRFVLFFRRSALFKYDFQESIKKKSHKAYIPYMHTGLFCFF
jgi:hypothetical protein